MMFEKFKPGAYESREPRRHIFVPAVCFRTLHSITYQMRAWGVMALDRAWAAVQRLPTRTPLASVL
jgi:hypothetical protein